MSTQSEVTVLEYDLVRSSGVAEFKQLVEDRVREGWRLSGGATAVGTTSSMIYLQSLTRDKKMLPSEYEEETKKREEREKRRKQNLLAAASYHAGRSDPWGGGRRQRKTQRNRRN